MEKEKLVSLVRGVQNNVDGAAGELYDAFYDDIYYHILKTVDKDPELAADLTQDTFMEILETIDKLQEPAAFVTWSKQIAYHKCTAYFRKRHEILLDEAEDGYSAFDTIEEDRSEFIPGEALDQEEFKQTIHQMISQLPGEQRSALLLRYFNEVSVKEIAEIQGVSENTVKSRLNYARKAIKQAVEDYEKKHGIQLHCVGVLPMLLWFFRAYRRANGMAVTVGSAAATYGVAAGATGTATAAATAAAATATEKTGLSATLSAFAKTTAGKVVAAVTATSIAVAGVAVIANQDKTETWSGYVQEYQEQWATEGFTEMDYDAGLVAMEDSRMYFQLDITEVGEYEYTGNLRITWDDGEHYESECTLEYIREDEEMIRYVLHADPIMFRYASKWRPDEHLFFLNSLPIWYHKDTDTVEINMDFFKSDENGGGVSAGTITGELTRETSGKTVFITDPIMDKEEESAIHADGQFRVQKTDGTYIWGTFDEICIMYENGELKDYEQLTDPAEWMHFYRESPDSDQLYVYYAVYGPTPGVAQIVIPGEMEGMTVTGIYQINDFNVTSIVLPDTIVTIHDAAFTVNHSLEHLELPNSLRHIGDYAFNYCVSLKTLVIPEGVETAGKMLFTNCENLESVYFPSTMTELGQYPFYSCGSLEVIEVAEGNPVYSSSGNCLIETESGVLIAGCKGSVIPGDGSVTTIGKFSFPAIDTLTEIVIPDGVKEIQYCAFFYCTELTTIHLPASMETINDQAFRYCDSLTDIYYAGTMAEFEDIQDINWEGSYQNFHLTVHCSDGDITIG